MSDIFAPWVGVDLFIKKKGKGRVQRFSVWMHGEG